MLQAPRAVIVVAAATGLISTASALSQSALFGPRIFDATGRMVGPALPFEPRIGSGRVILSFDKGEAVLNIAPDGLFLSTLDDPQNLSVNRFDASLYFTSRDCSGPAYIRVLHFPNYGLFSPQGGKASGYTQGGAVQYASRPFTTATLVAKKVEGRCSAMPSPSKSQLVGVAATAVLPSYKLPFDTK
jgi:hypothetical protein